MVKFKSAKKLPAKQLFELYKSVDWVKDSHNPKKHGALLSKVYANSNLVFSAWDKNKLVGTVRVVTDKYAHGVIFGLAVDPQYQNQGVATGMLKLCFKKYPKIQWNVAAETDQIKVFQDLGFQPSTNRHFFKGENPV